MPRGLKSAGLRPTNRHLSDKKLRQNMASTLFMSGDVLHSIMVEAAEEDATYSRNERNRVIMADVRGMLLG